MNYYEIEPEQNTFKTISIQTTYQCQLKCSNCYLGKMLNNENIPDIDINQFDNFLSKLPTRTDIRFIGAEPTMNLNLFKLIKLTRNHGHRPSMLTNGLKLRKEDYVLKLKKSGLNMLGLSMNGGLDDSVYSDFDGGRYAKVKSIALNNCFKYNIMPHINTIIDPSNLHIINPLINFIVESAMQHNRNFSIKKYPVALRIKSVGQMGFYKKTHTFSLNEMIDIMSEIHGFDIKKCTTSIINGYAEQRSLLYNIDTKNGKLLVKLTDWSVDDDGVPDSGSQRRGILNNNYKISPFFEYYVNEQRNYNNE